MAEKGRPAWARLGPPRPLRPEQRRLVLLLGTAFALNSYDFGLLGLALPQIQADLAVPESEAGTLAAAARLGMLPALLLALVADARGRRLLLILTVVGFALCSLATAFARSGAEFMVLQFLARTFTAAEEMLAIVVLTEELDDDSRGWGVGVMAAFGGLGHGLASLLYAQVDIVPYGWRALYALGVAPLLLVAWLRRGLPETRRFDEYRRVSGEGEHGLFTPLRQLFQHHRGRLLALCGAAIPFWFVASTALVFLSKFLQEAHGYTPGSVAVLFLVGGSVGILGNVVAGKMSDALGRRPTVIVFLLANLAAAAGFYNAPTPLVPVFWITLIFTFFAVDVIFAALGSELFPTAYRSTASAVRVLAVTLSAALGLWLEGSLYELVGSHASAVTWMLVPALASPLLVFLFLPETAGRPLEDISAT